MDPILGHKVKPAKFQKDMQHFRPLLLSGEELLFYGTCNNVVPPMSVIAVTNYRLVAGMQAGIRKEFWHDDPLVTEPLPKKGTLDVSTGDEKPYTIKMIPKQDFEALTEALESARAAMDLRTIQDARTEQAIRAEQAQVVIASEQRARLAAVTFDGVELVGKPISKKAALAIARMSGPTDRPWLIVHSFVAGVLVAWDDRLAIIKTGGLTGMGAGAMGGERSATFFFTDITGIEYNAGMMNGVLEVLTASYNGTANRDYWQGTGKGTNANANSPFTLSNTLPLDKMTYQQASEQINELRRRISEAKRPQAAVAAAPAPRDLAASLAQLAEMHGAGLLSDDEFTAAKQRLISQ